MTIAVIDVESTIYKASKFPKREGSPYSISNKLVNIGILWVKTGKVEIYYEEDFELAKESLSKARTLVGFNIKFDYTWLRRNGLLPSNVQVWDCQLWEFLESSQQWKYPDLDTTCERYGLGKKDDTIDREYWSKGIDTDEIPRPTLDKYLNKDLELTKKLFLYQLTQERGWQKLFRLQCKDLLVLQEMEWNGLLLDTEKCANELEVAQQKIESIEQELRKGYETMPFLNFDSGDHLSAYMYGGTITIDDRVPIGVYKTGAKVGQPRYKIVHYDFQLPQIIKPNDDYKLKKEGLWSTGEDALRSAKTNKKGRSVIDKILERSKLQKLAGTYYEGIPKLMEAKDWPKGWIHGQFNQVVAATGRLSATTPNQQNFNPEFKQLLVSRYV